MGLTLTIQGKSALLNRLGRLRREAAAELAATMLREMDKTRRYAIEERMEHTPGPPSALLHQRTGALANSIHGDARVSGSRVIGLLGVGVPYGRVHELGLTIDVPEHTQRRDQVFGRPTQPFTVTVRAHQASYPQRAFLRPSLEARRAEILASLGQTVRRLFDEA